MKQRFDLHIRWSAFPLHPETPEEGVTLEELFQGRNVNIEELLLKLKRVADSLGLPLGNRNRTFNSRLAQELGKWAEEEGKGDNFHLAMFKAYFVDGKNIAKIPLLVEIAETVSLDGPIARRVLEERTYKNQVDDDWQRAYELGITAVPTFMMNGNRMVGAQPYQVLEKMVQGSILA